MERVAITARLKEGADARARELIAAGPPFDPERAGLVQHAVFVGHELVVFVFEGGGVTRTLSSVLNDPLNTGAFSAWQPLLAEEPQLAHEIYYWNQKGVRWEDGHESVFTPGSDALIRHIERSDDDEPVLIHEP